MLVNRLKVFFPIMILEEPSAFVLGRLISDNMIIAYECMHAVWTRKCKKTLFVVKLDMAKAYDRVEWVFMEQMLDHFDFS